MQIQDKVLLPLLEICFPKDEPPKQPIYARRILGGSMHMANFLAMNRDIAGTGGLICDTHTYKHACIHRMFPISNVVIYL